MKKLSLAFALLLAVLNLLAQAPDYFHYQASVRNSDGSPMADQNVTVEITLIRGEIDAPSIYLESHEVQTNDLGMVTLKVGDADFFSEIDWENGPYFIGISINGTYMGASQLLSVPYALYAKRSGGVLDGDSDPSNEFQTLSINDMSRELSISDGNSVILPLSPWNYIETDIHFSLNVGIGMQLQPEFPLDIQKNIYGIQDRSLIRLKNIDQDHTAYVGLALEAIGNPDLNTFHRAEFLLTSELYTEIPDFNGMTAIRAPGTGFSVLSESVNGSVRFYTTEVEEEIYERMRITPSGDVQVKDGDVFIEDFSKGVILTSPDGSHFRITVDNTGNLNIDQVVL